MRKLGWEGNYAAWADPDLENEVARLKDGKLYAIGPNALIRDDLPIQKEMRDAAAAAGERFPPEQLIEGWIGGMAIEAALRAAGDNDPAKIQAAMQNLSVDTKGLRGLPIEWTSENHFRTRLAYRVYRWNPDVGAIEIVKDWFTYAAE